MSSRRYAGRLMAVATRHGKEHLLARPAEMVQLEAFACIACLHRTLLPRRDGLTAVDPVHGPYLNP